MKKCHLLLCTKQSLLEYQLFATLWTMSPPGSSEWVAMLSFPGALPDSQGSNMHPLCLLHWYSLFITSTEKSIYQVLLFFVNYAYFPCLPSSSLYTISTLSPTPDGTGILYSSHYSILLHCLLLHNN